MKYFSLLIVICAMSLMFSCNEKAITEKSNEDISLSVVLPNSLDSIICVDTLIYLALAITEDSNNKYDKLINNQLVYSTVNGKRFYQLTLITENSDTVRVISNYWDEVNNSQQYNGSGASTVIITVCLGEGCMIYEDIFSGDQWCEKNGSKEQGALECNMACVVNLVNDPTKISIGKAIFNNLVFASPYSN